MKSIFCMLALLLLAAPVMAEISFDLNLPSGSGDPISSITDAATTEIQNPTLSPCISPAWKLVSAFIINHGEEFDPAHCYQFFAVQAGDISQCSLIQRDPPKTKCFTMIAGNKNDAGICDQMPSTSDPQAYLKIDCLWEVAIKNNNKAACQAMGSGKISRMVIGEMSRQTCLARLKSGDGVGRTTL